MLDVIYIIYVPWNQNNPPPLRPLTMPEKGLHTRGLTRVNAMLSRLWPSKSNNTWPPGCYYSDGAVRAAVEYPFNARYRMHWAGVINLQRVKSCKLINGPTDGLDSRMCIVHYTCIYTLIYIYVYNGILPVVCWKTRTTTWRPPFPPTNVFPTRNTPWHKFCAARVHTPLNCTSYLYNNNNNMKSITYYDLLLLLL